MTTDTKLQLQDASFFDLPEFGVGHATNSEALTGCTVFVARGDCAGGVVCGVDVAGGAPATRETDLLRPENMVQKVNALLIGGGSAFGLEAACGVMDVLKEEKLGFALAGVHVPIVPAACLFDLLVGSPIWPDKSMGKAAATCALNFDESISPLESGCVGAGSGATYNKICSVEDIKRGAFAYSGFRLGELVVVGSVAVNAFGNIVSDADVQTSITSAKQIALQVEQLKTSCYSQSRINTTLGVVLTNAALNQSQATKVSQMAQDGYARAVVPVHTQNDGDCIFTMASGKVDTDVNVVGTLAAAAIQKAILSVPQLSAQSL